jgi:hypothetical protein
MPTILPADAAAALSAATSAFIAAISVAVGPETPGDEYAVIIPRPSQTGPLDEYGQPTFVPLPVPTVKRRADLTPEDLAASDSSAYAPTTYILSLRTHGLFWVNPDGSDGTPVGTQG